MKVVIMGAGVMGRRLARHFLRADFTVALLDPSAEILEKARLFLADWSCDPGAVLTAAAPQGLPPDWRDCPLVIEAVPEKILIKHAALAAAEGFFGPETLIASNTSGLTTAELAAGMRLPQRLAIAHFFNPADVIPVVELVAGPGMAEAQLQALAAILAQSGKMPAILRKEVPGFVANRIQHAMMRECLHLLREGVADAETLDRILRWSLGVRMAFFAPFLQRDLNGLDTHLSIAEYLYPQLAMDLGPADALRDRVAAGRTGRKAGQGFYNWDAAREAALARDEAELAALIGRMLAQEDETEEDGNA